MEEPKDFTCKLCGHVSEDEDDFLYCSECSEPFCLDHMTDIEHQGYQESLCPGCYSQEN
jgi:hypothetical protein